MSPKIDQPQADFREVTLDECAELAGPVPPRAERLPRFIGLNGSADDRLDSFGMAVVGTGSVGGVIAAHAARLQIRELQLCDPSVFKSASLLTHAIPPSAVGQAKVEYWGRWCKAISPRTRVRVFAGPVERLPLDAFADIDVVAMAPDNLAAEVEAGQRCVRFGKPLHQAAVHGESLVARNSTWTNRDPAGPCPACSFSELEWALAARQTRFACAGTDGEPSEEPGEVVPTTSTSFLCSLSAEFTMESALCSLLQLGPPIGDSVHEYCSYTRRRIASPLKRNSACPADHSAWSLATMPRPLRDCSLGEIAATAGLGGADVSPDVSFQVDHMTFAASSICCGNTRAVGRFVPERGPAGTCNACGRPMPLIEYLAHRPVPAAVLGQSLHLPLKELGADSARCVVVRRGDRSVLVRWPTVWPAASTPVSGIGGGSWF